MQMMIPMEIMKIYDDRAHKREIRYNILYMIFIALFQRKVEDDYVFWYFSTIDTYSDKILSFQL